MAKQQQEQAGVQVRITRKGGHLHAGKRVPMGEVLIVPEATAAFIEQHKIGERVSAGQEG